MQTAAAHSGLLVHTYSALVGRIELLDFGFRERIRLSSRKMCSFARRASAATRKRISLKSVNRDGGGRRDWQPSSRWLIRLARYVCLNRAPFLGGRASFLRLADGEHVEQLPARHPR